MEIQKVEAILAKHNAQPGALIEILLDTQEEFRYLPQEALQIIADRLKIPLARPYHLATFFKAFSLEPRGQYCISVCLGTACHVAGGVKILEQLERELNVSCGGTTPDMKFTLEEVHCLGCCGLAPVATVNEDVHGKLTLSKTSGMLKKYAKKD